MFKHPVDGHVHKYFVSEVTALVFNLLNAPKEVSLDLLLVLWSYRRRHLLAKVI